MNDAGAAPADWRGAIFDVFKAHDIGLVAHVPDGGHAPLIRACEADNAIRCVTLTTEEEGIGLLSGAWAGGVRGVLLMQSSGVGNCVNALALPALCRVPFVTLVTMRGEYGEFIPWQVPMGQATPKVLETMGVQVSRVDTAADVAPTVDAAIKMSFQTRASTAVLLSQKLIGAKTFVEGE